MKSLIILLLLTVVSSFSGTYHMLNSWTDVDKMTTEYKNRVKLALYNTSDEVLVITAGTPVSPGTNVSVVLGTAPENVVYTDDLTIGAVIDQELGCSFSFSVKSSTNNAIIYGSIFINGIMQVQKVLRKISVGGDVGAMSFIAVVPVGAGDVVGFYFDSDINTTLTIKDGASWVFETFKAN